MFLTKKLSADINLLPLVMPDKDNNFGQEPGPCFGGSLVLNLQKDDVT